MSESLDPQQQLKIQKGIRQAEDKLVTDIQTALDDTDSYGDLEESQFRNLVRVADTTESTQVIKNFLLYQLGRDKKWGRGPNSLAQKIISDIDRNIKATAGDIANAAKAGEDKNLFNQIWIELTRRYLGYGARYLVYKKKGQF